MQDDHRKKQRHAVFGGFRELVGTDLYRRNAFRVLGVSIDATLQSAVKSQKLREMHQKLGIAAAVPAADEGILPLSPPADSEMLRRSNECLQDPVLRFTHSFFWLWPSEPGAGSTVALNSLNGTHPAIALKAWLGFVESEPGAVTVRHNVAVLAHLLALDLEAESATHSPARAEQESGWSYWEIAYRQWRGLCDDPAFWQKTKSLTDAADDPRLPLDIAHRLQEWFPEAIIGTTAKLLAVMAERESNAGVLKSTLKDAGECFENAPGRPAIKAAGSPRAAESGSAVALLGHIRLLKKTGWDADALDRAIAVELQPALEHIRTMGSQLSEYTPATSRELLRDTLGSMLQKLAIVEALLAPDNAQRAATMDVVVESLLQAGISHGNEDHEWSLWLGLNDLLRDLATSPLLKDRLAKTTEVLRGNIEAAKREKVFEEAARALQRGMATDVEVDSQDMRVPQMCTCCLGAPELERAYSCGWENWGNRLGERGYTFGKVRHVVTINYPLCAGCERNQRNDKEIGVLLVTLPLLLAVALGLLCRRMPEAYGLSVAVGSTLAALLGMLLLARLHRYRPLDGSHACQGASVRIRGKLGTGACVTFMNPMYAQAFAQANGFHIRPPKPSNANRGVSPLGGSAGRKRALVVLACGLIASGVAFEWRADGNTATSSTSTSSSYTPPTQSWDTPSPASATSGSTGQAPAPTSASPSSAYQRQLASEIEAGKIRLRQLESDVQSEEQELKGLESEIAMYKSEIEGYESTSRLGGEVDQTAYQSAIDTHNSRVEMYNTRLSRYRTAVAEYNGQLEIVNTTVAQYNRGLNR